MHPMDKKIRLLNDFQKLKEKYNLHDYRFKESNGKNRLGYCDYTNKCISVSNYAIANLEYDVIYDILIHECAHAVAGQDAGHGFWWKQTIRAMGGIPERTKKLPKSYSQAVGHKYHSKPCSCGRVFKKHRLSKNSSFVCAKCEEDIEWIQQY